MKGFRIKDGNEKLDQGKNQNKKGSKKKALILSASVFVLGAACLIGFGIHKNHESDDKTASDENVAEEDVIEEFTYSEDFANQVDAAAKKVSEGTKTEDFARIDYDGDISKYIKIDNDNAFDKKTGKYAETDENAEEAEPFDRAKEEANEDSFLHALVEIEKQGEVLEKDGRFIFSSYDAIDKEKMGLMDLAVYYNDYGGFSFYQKMRKLNETEENLISDNIRRRNKIKIEKTINMHVGEGKDSEIVGIKNCSILFNNQLKTVVSLHNNEDITKNECFSSVSKDDCYSFMCDYLKNEGIVLDITGAEPCEDVFFTKQFAMKEQEINKELLQMASGNVLSNDCVFNIGSGLERETGKKQKEEDVFIDSVTASCDFEMPDGNIATIYVIYQLYPLD